MGSQRRKSEAPPSDRNEDIASRVALNILTQVGALYKTTRAPAETDVYSDSESEFVSLANKIIECRVLLANVP